MFVFKINSITKKIILPLVLMETIINREMLPEAILLHLHSNKIRMIKENGTIFLTPIHDNYAILEKSFGMFSDGKLSTSQFMKEREIDIELE